MVMTTEFFPYKIWDLQNNYYLMETRTHFIIYEALFTENRMIRFKLPNDNLITPEEVVDLWQNSLS